MSSTFLSGNIMQSPGRRSPADYAGWDQADKERHELAQQRAEVEEARQRRIDEVWATIAARFHIGTELRPRLADLLRRLALRSKVNAGKLELVLGEADMATINSVMQESFFPNLAYLARRAGK